MKPRIPVLSDGDTLDGRYQVQALLGTGGAGHVYRCLDMQTGHQRALKIVS